jgi:hypothetical protein
MKRTSLREQHELRVLACLSRCRHRVDAGAGSIIGHRTFPEECLSRNSFAASRQTL